MFSYKILLLVLITSYYSYGQTIQFTQIQRAPGAGYVPLTNASGVMTYTPSSSLSPASATISASSPLFYSAGTFSIQSANSSQNGALSSIDWTTFNSKGNAFIANTLAQFSPTTSAGVAIAISDETGSGLVVFNNGSTLSGTTSMSSVSVTGSAVFSSSTNTFFNNQNIQIGTTGKGFLLKEGANGMSGSVTLAAGTVTVSNTNVVATSRIFVTGQGTVGIGNLSVTKNSGVGFTINSSNPADARPVDYFIITGN